MSINDLPKFACMFVQVLGFWKEPLSTYCQDCAEESRYTPVLCSSGLVAGPHLVEEETDLGS